MRKCNGCGKVIKTKCLLIVPPMVEVALLGATERAYHPSCHVKAVDRGEEQERD